MQKLIKSIILVALISILLGCINESTNQNNIIPIWIRVYNKTQSLNYANQTMDGGYIVITNLEFPKTSAEGIYQNDAWLIKTDNNGNEIWNKTFGGLKDKNIGSSVEQTSNNGYIICGYSYIGSLPRFAEDGWLIRTDENGNKVWNKTFGGPGPDRIYYATQTLDGGYIAVGETYSNYDQRYANIHPYYRLSEKGNGAWLIKTDKNGNEVWNKTFRGIYNEIRGEDYAKTVQQVSDGYIIGGQKLIPINDSSNCPSCGFQIYATIIKTDINGNEQWNKTFGEENKDTSTIYVRQTSDKGYTIITTNGIIKIDKDGNIQWNRTFSGLITSGQQISDGSYIIAGEDTVIKLDSNGNMIWNKTLKIQTHDRISINIYSIRQSQSNEDYIITGSKITYGIEPESFSQSGLLLKFTNKLE